MVRSAGFELQIARAARSDIRGIMLWGHKEFGEQAASRYDALIARAFEDIRQDPLRPGVQQRQELGQGILVYHLRHSRARAIRRAGVVRRPRHFLVYRIRDHVIEVLRVLHDVRDLERHVPREQSS